MCYLISYTRLFTKLNLFEILFYTTFITTKVSRSMACIYVYIPHPACIRCVSYCCMLMKLSPKIEGFISIANFHLTEDKEQLNICIYIYIYINYKYHIVAACGLYVYVCPLYISACNNNYVSWQIKYTSEQ